MKEGDSESFIWGSLLMRANDSKFREQFFKNSSVSWSYEWEVTIKFRDLIYGFKLYITVKFLA